MSRNTLTAMLEIVFELKTITPAFLTGADPTKCELRWSSFAGSLRYWFRAMMGKIVGNNLDLLEQLEAVAFGATDHAAPFRACIKPFNLIEVLVPWEKEENAYSIPPGEHYLSFSQYSLIPKEERAHLGEDKRLLRSYYNVDTQFDIALRFRRPDIALRNVLLGTFWLLTHFGGIGTRTRRGFGGLAVENNAVFSPLGVLDTKETDTLRFRRMLQNIESTFRIFASRHEGNPPELPTGLVSEHTSFATFDAILISNRDAAIKNGYDWLHYWGMYLRAVRTNQHIGKKANRPDIDSLEAIMNLRAGVRTPDYKTVVSPYFDDDDPNTETPRILPNLPFGLPYMITSTSRKRTASVVDAKGTKIAERRASPVILRPILLKDGSLGCLFAFFGGRFLPDGTTLSLTGGANDVPVNLPDTQDINRTLANRLFTRITTDFHATRFSLQAALKAPDSGMS